jgi:iron complex outermembrane receptor protein
LSGARQLAAYLPLIPLQSGPVLFPNTCAFARLPASEYPGYCYAPIPASSTPDAPGQFKQSPWTFSASAKYKITDDINVYASFGRSFRAGGNNLASLPADPLLAAVRGQQPSETSNSYELGVKGSLLDRRLRFSAAVFQQDFKNLIVQIAGVPVWSVNDRRVAPRDIIYGADARVRGFEAELAARLGDDFDFSVNATYADGKFRNALIPCQTFDASGNAIQPTAAAPIAFCRSNGSSSSQPRFNANLQAEYRVPFGNNVGYLRTLTTYRGKATNEAVKFTAQDFATVNLFAGVRIGDIADISVYAKNLFNADVELFRAASPFADFGGLVNSPTNPLGNLSPTTGSGYFETRRNALREFGLSVRVQWGSN